MDVLFNFFFSLLLFFLSPQCPCPVYFHSVVLCRTQHFQTCWLLMLHGIAPCTPDRMTLQNCQPWYMYLWYLSFYGINVLIHLLWQNSSIFCFVSCFGSAGSIHCAQKTVSGVTASHLLSLLVLNLIDEHSVLTIQRVASPIESLKLHKAKTLSLLFLFYSHQHSLDCLQYQLCSCSTLDTWELQQRVYPSGH